jgi:hypothetical protein
MREQESGNIVSTLAPTGRGHTGFASETASATGFTKQHINSRVAIGEKITKEAAKAPAPHTHNSPRSA